MPGPSADSFGLGVTTAAQECVKGLDAYYEAVLAYRPFSAWSAAADLALAGDGACPLARVLAADYAVCSGDSGRAKELLEGLASEEASGAAEAWTWRERQYAKAWQRWALSGDLAGCYEALLEVVGKHPEDLFAVKRGQIMGLILGDSAKIFEIVELAGAAARKDPPPRYLHGMWAFGLEQRGEYEAAEEKAREGMAFEKELGPDAWLDHGLAHALYFQGDDRLDEAIEYLESRGPSWGADALHPFLYTHNWWHLSLLRCEKRDFAGAVALFDERLWSDANADMRGDPQVQLNALNLLWRLETRGQGDLAKPRWAKVLEACRGVTLPSERGAKHALQHSDLLLDVLLVRGLCAQAEVSAAPLEAFLAACDAHAKGLGAGDGRAGTYGSIVQSVAELYRADRPEASHLQQCAAAKKALRELEEKWSCLGGSEEQRGVLLEAVEGPVVCGEPERNYDSLFM